MYGSAWKYTKLLAATEQSCWQPSSFSRPSGSSEQQHQHWSRPRRFRVPHSNKHHRHLARASGDHLYRTSDPSSQIAEGDKAKRIAATAEPQLPLLPLSLLISLSAAWCLTARGSSALQCSTLLLLDIVYAGLHLQPLLPLLQEGSAPDVAFMQSYTKATYFVSECLLLGWLVSNEVIRAIVPWFVLAVHGAVHVGFVGLAAQVPGWCMQQQIHRIENGWDVRGLAGKWHVLVNMVNFADLILHLCYITVLWQSLGSAGNAHAATMQQPTIVAIAGLVTAYVMAKWLPKQQLDSHM